MQLLKPALRHATAEGEFVSILLEAMGALMSRGNAEILALAASQQVPTEDQVRKLSIDFERLVAPSIATGRLAAETAHAALDRVRDACEAARLQLSSADERQQAADACAQTVAMLETSIRAVNQSQRRIRTAADALGEIARDRAASPELARNVRSLLARIAREGPQDRDTGH